MTKPLSRALWPNSRKWSAAIQARDGSLRNAHRLMGYGLSISRRTTGIWVPISYSAPRLRLSRNLVSADPSPSKFATSRPSRSGLSLSRPKTASSRSSFRALSAPRAAPKSPPELRRGLHQRGIRAHPWIPASVGANSGPEPPVRAPLLKLNLRST